jgi:flagellar hook-associated protein 2
MAGRSLKSALFLSRQPNGIRPANRTDTMSVTPDFRISGLASGFDVGATIAKIMEMEGSRVKKVQDEQALRNDTITAWIDVKDNLSSLTRASDSLRWMDVWRKMASTSTNASVATATAAPGTASATYTIDVSKLARAHTIATASGLTDAGGDPVTQATLLTEITGISLGDQFAIGGQTFTISDTETLTSLRDKINAATGSMPASDQVTASILDNRLVLQRVNTGAGTISLSDTTGSPLATLGILDGSGNPANELLAAQDAEFTVNGAVVTRSSNTGLADIIDGVTLNLYNTGYSEVTVGRDNAAIKEAINTFIEAYNTAAEVNEFYGNWDRSDPSNPIPGMLQGNSMMREITYKLRELAGQLMNTTHTAANAGYSYNGAQGIMDSLQHIGIWTQGESNRLAIIDEERLDAMLEQYPEEVENLFRGVPSESEAGVRVGGIALSMYTATRNYASDLDGWIDVGIENINDEITRQDERIERMTRELEMKEAMLWRQFGAMDEAIGKMQSGFEFLLGQIGGSNK